MFGEPLELDDDDVLRLHRLWRVAELAAHDVDEALEELLECSFAQFTVLRAIKRSETTVAVADLARILRCSKANASKLVVPLERVGWVEKVKSTVDGRVTTLWLTPRGRDAYASCNAELAERAKRLFRRLGEDDKKSLDEALEKVRVCRVKACLL